MSELILKGVPAAPGITVGRAYILDKKEVIVSPRSIIEQEIPIEIARFEEALIRTREEIATLQKKISDEMGTQHAQIFDAHLLALEDRTLIEDVIKGIRQQQQSAEYVFSLVLKKYAKIFSNMKDEYLRDRMADINDIGRRVLNNLIDESKIQEFDALSEELIIIAHDLSPSDTVNMFNKKILGFATDMGSRTSHTAIMAKSLGVPAVVGLKDMTLRVANQDMVIIDGRMGLVIVNPSSKTLEVYREEKTRLESLRHRFDNVKTLPAQTRDEKKIGILANLEVPAEIPAIKAQGAEGIGLYRTEFFYMNRATLPTEEEQYEAYKKVAEEMSPYPVTIRTVDIGGDKYISSVQIPRDMSPFLGWRAIKFCFERPDIFKIQLRAILRASAHGPIKMMFPMIAGPEDWKRAMHIVEGVKADLKKEGLDYDEAMPIGVMIEVPSAAMTADMLADEVDFFSIGTNDLVQYALAVDRANEQLADFYEPCHPAVLRLIKLAVDAARNHNIPISVCGEMASEPNLALLLIGLGIDELSMTSMSMLQIKQLVRSVDFSDAKQLADEVMMMDDGKEIEQYCKKRVKQLAPEIFDSSEAQGD